MDESNLYLIINVFIYAFLVFVAIKYTKQTAATFVVFVYYLLTAITSILFYNHPFTSGTIFDRPIHIEALLYLALMTCIITYPVATFDRNMSDRVYAPKDSTVIGILAVCFFIQLILYASLLSYFLSIWNAPDIEEMRDDVAEGGMSPYSAMSGMVGKIFLLYNFIRNIAVVIAIYAFVFVKKRRSLVVIASVSTLFYPMFYSFLYVMRSQIFLQIVTIIFFLVILRHYISARTKKWIIIGGSVFGVFAFFSLVLVSQARFGDMVTWSYYRYMGEPFINFSSQLWPDQHGTTDGMAYFRWFLTGEDWKGLPDKWAYINQHAGVDGHVFNTAPGQLMTEFGSYATVAIYLLISFIFYKAIKSHPEISLSNLLIISLLSQMIFYGIYLFPFQGTAIVQVFFYLIAIAYFRKQERLTEVEVFSKKLETE